MAIIYGVAPSPYVRKTMLAHAFKGIPYELKVTIPGSDDPEFREGNPLGKVPAYRTDDGFAFADSSVIIASPRNVMTQLQPVFLKVDLSVSK